MGLTGPISTEERLTFTRGTALAPISAGIHDVDVKSRHLRSCQANGGKPSVFLGRHAQLLGGDAQATIPGPERSTGETRAGEEMDIDVADAEPV